MKFWQRYSEKENAMKYYILQLSFPQGVHFGQTNLDECNMTFHADTLFSALYIEAVKCGKKVADQLLQAARKGTFLISDAFPYIGKECFLPKPMLYIERNEDIGNSVLKKTAKKLGYISLENLEEYIKGDMDIKKENNKFAEFGYSQVKTSAAIRGREKTEPYHVGIYTYGEGNGLFFFAGMEEELEDTFWDVLDMLSFSGIGGKRSSGLGRFSVEKMVPVDGEHFEKPDAVNGYLLLSTALPKEEEMESVLEGAEYLLEKRSGFIQSQSFGEQQRKKCDQYFFKAGSHFTKRFSGDIYQVAEDGKHPVYRYGKPLFWAL